MKTFLVSLLILISTGLLFAEPPEKKDPIDIAVEKAIEKDPSTAGMIQAAADAESKWDAEMNIAYKKLKKAMKPEEWKALEASQKAWLAFRDKEKATQAEIFSRMEGTMWRPVAANESAELVKARTLTLRGYLSTISERD